MLNIFSHVSWLFVFLMAQMAKNLPMMQEPRFNPWVRKIPQRRKWLPTPVFLPGGFYGQRSLVGYSPRGRKELDTPEQLTHISSLENCLFTAFADF